MQRRGNLVRYNVVHVVGSAGARVAKPHHLNGSRFESKDLVPRSLGVAVHVDENMDTILIDAVGRLTIVRYL